MHISRILCLIALAAVVSACQTLTPEQQRAADEAKCSGYGFKLGTPPFANCLMNLDLDRRADQRAFMYGDNDPFWGGPTVIVGGGYGRHWHRW
ncbi:hypothetical protein DTW90_10590 [Neorhizobium sp. P12A]|jgi:hypothetical protein|uniref:hypothetical protein n=1 Tax=Rhizobium/Agrobacterium group TaxID=227290 RepID=UPI0010507EB6|nr:MULTISPECIES: hypothetical protein [Rhizobium/Agrobacterium group]KAA0699785.1 hypothetical protein DTW90_10590 [Neorhizobium sp. P12A]TCR93404.1 hypothetical protein EV561_101852 [Rhizobium sp. BK376]